MNQREFTAGIRTELDALLDAGEIVDIEAITTTITKKLQLQKDVQLYVLKTVLCQLVRKEVSKTIASRERLGSRAVTPTSRREPAHAASSLPATRQEQRLVRIGSTAGPIRSMKIMLRQQGRTMDFGKWVEFEPVKRIELQLPAMNRQQLMDAAAYRYNNAATEVHNAAFLRQVAEGLGPGQLVQDVYDNATLTAMWAEITATEEFSIASSAAEPAALEG